MTKTEKISAVYKITNTITGDLYIGSSKDVKRRWLQHKCQSSWKQYPNNRMYQDMKQYGVDKFRFQILVPVMEEYLKQVEQECIDLMKPTYNSNNAKGWDVERRKKSQKKAQKKYQQSEKGKKSQKKYQQSEKGKESQKKYQKEYQKKYQQSEKRKEYHKKYYNQSCSFNGETLTLAALTARFQNAGIPHPTLEAKKYLINKQ